MTTEHLSREHMRTLQAIFQHPAPRNLEWRHIMALVETIGTITEDHNGGYHVTINGQIHTIQRSRHKDLADLDELVAMRHFLARADIALNKPHQGGDPDDDTSTHVGGD